MSNSTQASKGMELISILMHLQQDSIKVDEPFYGVGMDKIENLRSEAKQAIKALVLELIDNTMLYNGGLPDASINLEQIRQKVEAL